MKAAAGLALVGALISGYLAANQVGWIQSVWDPFFGSGGSEQVLHSFISKALPVPDALLGMIAYLLEVAALTFGLFRRWAGWLVAAMALGGLALVGLQAFVLRAGCTLCITSAVISWAIGWLYWRNDYGAS